MSTPPNYWISDPGRSEQLAGPLSLEEIKRGVAAGAISPDAKVCAVGASEWSSVPSVVSRNANTPPALTPAFAAGQTGVFLSRTDVEGHYVNLAAVGAHLRFVGTMFKLVGVVAAVSGGIATPVYAKQYGAGVFWAILACVFGVFLFSVGIVIAAAGEALSALKDIAVNTRITADRAERQSDPQSAIS